MENSQPFSTSGEAAVDQQLEQNRLTMISSQEDPVSSVDLELVNSLPTNENLDRLAVITAGGIALGAAIAQLPGAVVGGLIGVGYGIYIGFIQKEQ
jgi:hypothetical protein